ncbi:MAG TPA: DUF1109 domain-containing protein [Hyphomicrobiaceae bacterium]|nr:DUF1109 domain-containing protein [Hyphomicrobiaceae bacterium]
MRTEDLIEAIARDAAAPRPWLGGRMALALLAGGAVSYALYAVELGVRLDILSVLFTWRFLLKIAVVTLLVVAACWASARLARPDMKSRNVTGALAAAPAILAMGVGYELLTLPAVQWPTYAIGTNAVLCLISLPLLSVAPLLAMLAALRSGAPRSATAAGAVAGLLAGGMGATLYGTHCFDDSPLFVAIWYSIAIGLVVLAGAILGRYLLRW